jgi:hypothetical protein
MDSSRRTHHLVDEILELLRELSYETQRQERTISDLQAKVAALEAREVERQPSEAGYGTARER